MKRLYMFAAAAIAMATGGCGATMSETHYFAAVDPATNRTQNVFRLTVRGGAGMSNARYMAGFYDERAVDLFFNQVGATSSGEGNLIRTFANVSCTGKDAAACAAEREALLTTFPVGDPERREHGVYIMLLSSNADAIAQTIGGFAESQQTISDILHFANQDVISAAARIDATADITSASRAASGRELRTIFEAAKAAAPAERDAAYLAMLSAAAAALQPGAATTFANIAEARAWFDAARRLQP